VANLVKADVDGVAVVNTSKPSVFVYVPEVHANAAGVKVDHHTVLKAKPR
jgi:hypothetical protein